ncbi:TetR/AcrR family transcriptional regulator [Pseudomonas entomophila]|uniref:TetR/AcrR family transcriptional regulator n=1 Tax=Pseudomonas entomophila TaxID=312306 RepID=UPI003EBABFB8
MSTAKEKLLTTALQLFIKEGVQSVGIDKVIRVSGVSKMTLYKYFPSKDNLIEEALTLYHYQIIVELQHCLAEAPPVLEQQLMLLLNWYKSRFMGPEPRACLFVSAANLYPSRDHPVHRVCLLHKHMLIDLLAHLLTQFGYAQAAALALQCLMLFEGAQNLTAIGVDEPIDAATTAILMLLEAHR